MEGKRDSFFLSNKKLKDKKPRNEQDVFNKKRQGKFDQNRDSVSEKAIENTKKQSKIDLDVDNEKSGKIPFDKKTYRLKKYSKKYKLEQWEDQRKKKLLREFYKEVKNDTNTGSYKPKTFDEDMVDANQEVGKYVRHPDFIAKDDANKAAQHKNKKEPFWKAKEQFNKIKQQKIDKKQEMEKVKEERNRKLQDYKKKKQERFKKLSKKTKKGQPVMTGRLELLLEKIQKG